MATISMRCKDCGGILDVDETQNIMFCPYCGSKELILESDEVKKERIKYETMRDMALGVKAIEQQTKIDEIEAQERKEKRDNRNSAIVFALMALASILCFIFAFK